jgi:tetratricopeptide (TPR) repeat protein
MQSMNPREDRFVEENNNAEAAIAANNLTEAAGILVGIIGKDPENARAFNNIGIISWSQKNWQDAYNMFVKSVSLQPDYADALVNLFDAALKLKKIDEIRPYFDLACIQNPDLEEITILRDSMHEQGDNIYKSRRALAIGVYNPCIEEAKKELESGNLFKAMELFLKVNDTEGPDAAAFCGLGIISYYQERYNDAFVLFIESIKLNPTDTETFMNLLDAAKECNRLEEAKTIYTSYLNEFPELGVLKEHFGT